jgi:hypothetical protein
MSTSEPPCPRSKSILTFAGKLVIVLIFLGVCGFFIKWSLFPSPKPSAPNLGLDGGESLLNIVSVMHRDRDRPATNPAPRVVDLLTNIDLRTATVTGRWKWKDGATISDLGAATRFDFGYCPPNEYDLRFEFARLAGNDGIDTILSFEGRQFCWTMGGWGNTTSGFSEVFGQPANANPTTVRDQGLKNNQRYTCVIKVRNDKVQAYLDDQRVSEWSTDFDDLGMSSRRLHRNDSIGISTWESSYAIYSAQIVEITGAGRKVGSADPLQAKPVGIWNYTVQGREPVPHVMYSNGHMKSAEGDELWFLHGNKILFRWGPFLDSGLLSADGRSFDGSNQSGELIHGDFIPGGS